MQHNRPIWRSGERRPVSIPTNEATPVTWIVAAGFIAIFAIMAWPILEKVL